MKMSIYIKIKTKPVNDFDGNATITRIKRKIYLQPDYLLKMNPSYMKYTSELFGV